MFRTFCLAASALAIVVVWPARAGHEHAEHLLKCAKVCADCQLQCDSCFKHCLSLVAGGNTEHKKSAQLCVDCADCCKLCAALCARQSPLANPVLDCCAKCCDQCAAGCEKLPQDKHMAQCAKSCRDCAQECRAMLKHVGTALPSS